MGNDRSVSWAVARIDAAAHPLRALSGPGRYATEAIFDFAYGDLPDEEALIYRRLGLHPGVDFTAPVAAVLSGQSEAAAMALLESLVDAHLVEPHAGDRYRFHGLVRAHAQLCVTRDEPAPVREDALRRLVDWYYAALRVADRAVVADRMRLTNEVSVTATNLPSLGSARDAFEWFGAEQANVLGVIRLAVEREWDDRVWHIAEALWPFCYNEKLYSLWVEAYEAGLAAARRLGDLAAEGRMGASLARAYCDLGQAERATAEMERAVVAAAGSGNLALEASVTEFAAIIKFEQGDVRGALTEFHAALEMFERCGRPRGVALQAYQIGKCLIRLGDHRAALTSLDRAFELLELFQDDVTQSRVLRRRGEALAQLAEHAQARIALERSLDLARRCELRLDEAQTLEVLAAVAEGERRPDVARQHRQSAYRLYKEIGHPRADALLPMLS